MALTDDQRAMLRLLAQREEGYGDIAALTGQSVEDVRGKVKEAIAALDGPGAPADDQRAMLKLLAQREQDYGDIAALTGQSAEDVRAKVAVALSALDGSEPGAAAEAQASPPPPPVAPEASKPAPPPPVVPTPLEPESKPKPKPPRTPAKPARAGKGAMKLPEDRGAVWGLGAGLAVILVFVVLLATGVLGGGDDSNSDSSGESPAGGSGSAQQTASGLTPTQAVLKAVDGGGASGRALFGKDKQKVVLVVQARGLEPSPQGKSYTVSLAKSADERLPLIATKVPASGKLVSSFQIAPQVLGLLASGWDTMEVSLVANKELGGALEAAKTAKSAPQYSGVDVLRGPVTGSIVEAGEEGEVKP